MLCNPTTQTGTIQACVFDRSVPIVPLVRGMMHLLCIMPSAVSWHVKNVCPCMHACRLEVLPFNKSSDHGPWVMYHVPTGYVCLDKRYAS